MANVNLLFGPMLIGVFLNMILYGILIMQMFTYFQTYTRDSPLIRYLVLYLFIVETLNTGFDIGVMYEPLIVRYGTSEATTFFPIMFATEPVCIVAISTPIQLFISWRIRRLSQSNWVPAIICLLAFTSFGGGVWTTIRLVELRRFALKPKLHTPALVWFIPACAADLTITVSLVMSLWRRKTGFTATDDIINRIIRLTVQTGMITAIAAIGDVIFFLTLPHTTLNFIWDLALSKLYTNSLMSTLNSRAGWNNLINGNNDGNVLFGSESRSLNHRREISNYPSAASHVYELDSNPKSPHRHSHLNSKVEVEYGISVTKVVERLQDPLPSDAESTQ